MTRTVLYVENGLHGGGSAESLCQLLSVLDRDRFRPVVAFGSPTRYVDRVASLDVPTVVLEDWYMSRPTSRYEALSSRAASAAVIHGARFLPRSALALDRTLTSRLRRTLAAIMARHEVALVHTNNNVHRDLWAVETAAAANVPCIAHLRSFHALGFSQARAALANRCAAAFIAYSRSIAEFWTAHGLAPERVHVIHNAIGSLTAVPVDLTASFGIPPGSRVIGIIGRIIPERGHAHLLRALPAVIARFPDLRLLVVGAGDPADLKTLGDLANRLGVAAHVTMAGHRADVHGIIAALDAIVLPYAIEPFGRTVLEAWQLGTPVVLSRVGHVGDIVRDGEDALLFHLDDPAALTAQLIRLLSDEALRRKIARAGQEVCRRRFSITAHKEAVEQLYERVLLP